MYPKSFYEDNRVTVQNRTCFVLMPFGKEFDRVHDLIVEAVSNVEFSASRADDVFAGGHIIEDILRGIGKSEVVIADVTGKNPNVFYELGIAHMVKNIQNVLILTQSMEDIPFDLRALRCITYESSDAGLRILKARLNQALREVVGASIRFSVRGDQTYKLPKQLLGPDRAFYTFEIPELWIGEGAAKFRLCVYRHVLGEPAGKVSEGTEGLLAEEAILVPGLSWHLTLDRVDGETAYFSLSP